MRFSMFIDISRAVKGNPDWILEKGNMDPPTLYNGS
jgi:hypothetical protein